EMELPAAPPLSGLNAGTLLAHIDRSWDFRHGLSERITANLPKLQARAVENQAAVNAVLASRANRG
ncbi:MAG TPA: polysaccharide pyruvyl transferase, partial [Verrucomicrobiae bacterium]|nr:polysaccharide pyruvyl transferase [Verrucomicrobiae bacterium]